MSDEERIHEARFSALIFSLHAQAMVQLGKLAEPGSGEIRRDLGGARGTIDLLETLAWKLARGVEEREKKLLDSLLTELRLNYLDEAKRDEEKPGEAGDEEPPSGDADSPENDGSDEAPGAGDDAY